MSYTSDKFYIPCLKGIFLFIIVLASFLACSSDKSVKKGIDFEPEVTFNQANEKIKKGDYSGAREILAMVKAQDASGKYAPLAQVRIGDTYFEEGSYEEAAIEYEQFIKIHPYHRHSSYVQYQLAMCYFNSIRTPDVSYSDAQGALIEFEKLLKLYPRNPYIDAAENRIKMCKSILAEYEFYVGKFYFKKGSYNAAALRLNGLIQNYPESKKEPEALYYLGLSYKNLNNQDKTLTTLTSLIEKYPANSFSKEAKEIIASLNNKEK